MLGSTSIILRCHLALRALGGRACQQPECCLFRSNTLLKSARTTDLQFADPNGAVRCITTSHTHIPKSKHDLYRTPPKNYVQLLQHVTRARQLRTLEQLVHEYGPKFDGVHVAAAMSVLPQLAQPPRPGARLSRQKLKQRRQAPEQLLAQLQEMAAAQVPRMFPREVASITWALGRCRRLLPGASGHNPATRELVAALLARLGKDGGRMLYQAASGAEVAKLLHGLARLKLGKPMQRSVKELCMFVQRQPERLHAKELAAAAWALAKMRLPGPAVAGALDTISRAAVERRLYLRPVSICSLATACAHTGRRRDEQLLATLTEESLAQIKDFRPQHLAVLCWAFGRLDYNPGPQLLAAIAAGSSAQLERFDAQHLGLLLQGLRQLQGLDQQLLADIASGIRKEEAVALSPRDAVRILAAFVAAPHAGAASAVDGMAARIGDAVQRRAASAPLHTITNLLVCYSKLPAQHPVLLRLLEEAAEREQQFSMDQWVRMLQACQRLGFSSPGYRDARVNVFYKAAEKHLQRHLAYASLPRADGQAGDSSAALQRSPKQQQEQPRKRRGWLQRGWQKLMGGEEQQRSSEQDQGSEQLLEQPAGPHTLQWNAAVDLAKLLGERGQLPEATAAYLAHVGLRLLPGMSTRRVMLLMTAVTSGENMATNEVVRQLLAASAEHLVQTELSQQSLTVLAGFARPLGRALVRNMMVSKGEQLVRSWYAALLPRVKQCDQAQLLALVECMHALEPSGMGDAALQAAAEDLAAQQGWALPVSKGWGPLGQPF